MHALYSLRHSAKEILAAAVLELFPHVQLVGGDVDAIGFSYAFLFPKDILARFSERELLTIEDQMIRLIYEDRPIKTLEMMRENAVVYLNHLMQPMRAQATLNAPTNIVSMIEIGTFKDFCPASRLVKTGELKAFKLQKFETDQGIVKIYGTAFFDKKELKAFLKQYKEASKHDPLIIGPKKGYFLPVENEEWIYLHRGQLLLQTLRKFWEKEHADFEQIVFSDHLERTAIHALVMERKKSMQVASFSLIEGDFISIQCAHEEELFNTLISSLHFIEKAFKIFAFEPRVYYVGPESGWLLDVLRTANYGYERELPTGREEEVTFRVADRYGRIKTLSYLRVEREKKVLHRSLFCSPSRWIAHMVEMGVEI